MNARLDRWGASRPAAWLRDHPLLLVTGVGLVVAVIAFAWSRPVLLVNDGDAYMEMARAMRHGTLEVPNGLDIWDSPELTISHTVRRGAHEYAKYPPLYAWLAVGPFALLGIRGMYLLNAASFALMMPAFYLLARRVLGPSRARTSTLLVPFALPLVSYTLVELPHLVSAALVTWGVVLWDRSRREHAPQRAGGLGLGAGLLLGLAFGVRLQNVVLVVPLVAVGWLYGRHRRWALGGLAAGAGACALAMAAYNHERFGSSNPFSYGPASPEESVDFFVRPAFVGVVAVSLAALLVARGARRRSWTVAPFAAAFAAIAAVPAMRAVACKMAATMGSFLLNATMAGSGWATPDYTHKWMEKALLVCAPFLVLGLLGAVASCARRAPPLPMAMGWMVVLTLLFLSARDPDPQSGRSVMGFMSLSPRYLVDLMVPLFLLAWRQVRALRIGAAYVLVGAGVAAALLLRMLTDPDDFSTYRIVLLSDGSVALAALTVAAFVARRSRAGAVVLAGAVAIGQGYAAACVYGEDCVAYTALASVFQRWGDRITPLLPSRTALVAWSFAKDPVFCLRADHAMIMVDPQPDDAASLAATLDALVAHGWAPFYYGYGDELASIVRPRLRGRYDAVELSQDPPLWRLDPVKAP